MITELIKVGWYIVSPRKENHITNILFSQKSIHDYKKLCSLDCLGVSEKQDKPDDYVYEKSRKQLGRGAWNNLIRNLSRLKSLEPYDKVMQDQIRESIVERVKES